MHNSNTAQFWRDLVEIGKPFPADRWLEIVEARNFSSRMRQVRDETGRFPTGSDTHVKTIGMECVAFSVAATTEFVEARDHIRREPYNFLR